jgi:uncharacterized protein (DUF885 family)
VGLEHLPHVPAFLKFLRTDPQFYPKTPHELLGFSAYVAKRVYDLPSRALYTLTALTLCECNPGHAFQAITSAVSPMRSGVSAAS